MTHERSREKVLVLGAGIAGLTAAHELAERGFEVEVVDKTPDPRNPTRPLLGGLAASQWSRVPLPLSAELAKLLGVELQAEPPQLERGRPLISFKEIVEPPGRDSYRPFMVHDWPAFWLEEGVSSLGTTEIPGDRGLFREESAEGFAKMLARTFANLTAEGGTKPEVVLVATTIPSLRALRDDPDLSDALDAYFEREKGGNSSHDSPPRKGRWKDLRKRMRERAVQRISLLLTTIRATLAPSSETNAEHGPPARALSDAMKLPRDAGFGNLGRYQITDAVRISGSTHRPILVLGGWVTLERSSPFVRTSDLVQIRVRQQLLPGEHGYRFFPSFYRNLFDTMQRIPILEDRERDTPFVVLAGEGDDDDPDDDWKEEGRFTVLDNLTSITRHAIALQDENPPIVLPRTNDYAFTSWLRTFDAMQQLDIPLRDLARANLRMIRFMTSCADRRRTYAATSFRDHITSEDTSEAFVTALDTWPQALAGLRAQDADARAMGSVSLQLALDQMRPQGFRDGTLNAPTTEAWFDHWYEWLHQRYGVEFTVDEVTEFDGHMPKLKGATDKNFDYIVCALDLHAMLKLVPAHPSCDPLRAVLALKKAYRDTHGESATAEREAIRQVSHLRPPGAVEDRLRARLAGIHLGEPQAWNDWDALEGRVGTGDDPHAEAQSRVRPGQTLPFRFYGGIQFYLERDYRIFDGHTYFANSAWRLSSVSQMQFRRRRPARLTAFRGILSVIIGDWLTPGKLVRKPACACTKEEVATEVWYQIYRGLEGSNVPPDPPQYFHLDDAIEAEAPGGFLRSKTPFLVNLTSLNNWWPETPGRYQLYPPPKDRKPDDGTKIVFCGTWLGTYTRMVTMESANESARHAVNAILDDQRKKGSPRGSNCATYNLEDAEPPDLKPLIALDQELYARGLPHMMDILDVEHALLPRLATGDRRDVLALLHEFVRTQGGLAAATGGWLLDGLRRL